MTEFMGIPISGDVDSGRWARQQQCTHEELAELFKAVMDDDFIEAISWEQYTSYFNDGDTCEFRACEISVKTTADPMEWVDDPEPYYVGQYHPTLGNLRHVRNIEPTASRRGGTYYNWHDVPRDNPHFDADRLARCEALDSAIGSGAFYQVLNELFGDHARVTVCRTGITVDFYEHD